MSLYKLNRLYGEHRTTQMYCCILNSLYTCNFLRLLLQNFEFQGHPLIQKILDLEVVTGSASGDDLL